MPVTPVRHISGALQIFAPPEVVFGVVADERNEPRYNSRVRAVELATPLPVGEGSVFRAETGSRRRATPMTIEFTRFEPPRCLGSSTRLPWMDIDGEVIFEGVDGGTCLHWEWSLRPIGRLVRVAPVVARIGAFQERRTWRALKRYVEGQQLAPSNDDALEDVPPLPYREAVLAVARCVANTAELLAHRQLHFPRHRVGLRLQFGDGTTGRVYRETVADDAPATDRCVLVVSFGLRAVQGIGHRAFEIESILNTPLFAGFPGFVSKLWMSADERGAYRGLYEWDDPRLAMAYARALWRVLALVSEPGSIHYRVCPGLRRDGLLADPAIMAAVAPDRADAWWRVIGTG